MSSKRPSLLYVASGNDEPPSKWFVAVGVAIALVWLSVTGLMLTAMTLGVMWLWRNL